MYIYCAEKYGKKFFTISISCVFPTVDEKFFGFFSFYSRVAGRIGDRGTVQQGSNLVKWKMKINSFNEKKEGE